MRWHAVISRQQWRGINAKCVPDLHFKSSRGPDHVHNVMDPDMCMMLWGKMV